MEPANKYTKNCQSCVPREKDAYRMLLDVGTCRNVLRTDQHGARGWLGRSICYTVGHLNQEQTLAAAKSIYRCKTIHFMACQRLLGATRVNYAEAGNKNIDAEGNPTSDPLYHHPHEHILPRYKNPIEWNGKRFVDRTFFDPMELNHTPTEKEKKLNEEYYVNIPLTLKDLTILKSDIQKEFVRMMFDANVPSVFRPKWEEIADAYPSDEVINLYKVKSCLNLHSPSYVGQL